LFAAWLGYCLAVYNGAGVLKQPDFQPFLSGLIQYPGEENIPPTPLVSRNYEIATKPGWITTLWVQRITIGPSITNQITVSIG